ncbi:unnamed protein product [Prunus brigantina]
MMRMLMKALNNDNEATEREALELLIELADTEPRFIKRQRESGLGRRGSVGVKSRSGRVYVGGSSDCLIISSFGILWIVINLFDFLPYEASVTCMQSSGNLEFESVAWTWTSESLDWHLAKPYNF